MYTDTHKKLVSAFQDVCYWNYEIRSALKVMCGYTYRKIDYHMYRVIMSMKEYWMLQISKLFDKKYTFNDQSKPNLVVDYLIDEVPWPADVRAKLVGLKSEMEVFSGCLKEARDKIIAHHDLKVDSNRKNDWLGSHKPEDEDHFYANLLEFLNLVQTEINGSPSLPWPEFSQTDTEEFVHILESTGHAIEDNA